MKFMTKPIFVDAVRWHGEEHPAVFQAIEKESGTNGSGIGKEIYAVQTPMGSVRIDVGDWIVKDPNDNIFVMEDQMFTEKFEKVIYGS